MSNINDFLYKAGTSKNNTPILLTINSFVDYQEQLLSFLKGLLEQTKVNYQTYLQSVNTLIVDANNLKRKDVETIFDHINVPPLENGLYKICVIENIDCLTPLLSNSLLKTIEEPTSFTYLFFTTNNIANVLDTIKSRCNIINICADTTTKLEHEKIKKLNEEQTKSLISAFKNLSSLKSWLDDETSFDVINMFLDLVQNQGNELNLLPLNNNFVKLEYNQIKILLNWLMNYYYQFNPSVLQLILENYDVNISKYYIFHCIVQFLSN